MVDKHSQITEKMSGRERFRKTMRYDIPDRVPYFEEGIRKSVLKVWQRQGLPKDTDLFQMFPYDKRESIEPDLEPRPKLISKFRNMSDLKKFRRSLDPYDKKRLPKKWAKRVRAWKERDWVLMLKVHRGFFLTMGVYNWPSFTEVMYMLIEKPAIVQKRMAIQGEFSARLIGYILQEVEIDAAVFTEPIGGNDRPLISPKMYEEFVLKSYAPVLDVLKQNGVATIIFQTFANVSVLIPTILKWGFNCLWAHEVDIDAMNYRNLRQEFGPELRLIGGIDLDALRQGKASIKREIEEKVPALISDGGYVPLADGRIREDVPFENYVYYRRLLEKVTQR